MSYFKLECVFEIAKKTSLSHILKHPLGLVGKVISLSRVVVIMPIFVIVCVRRIEIIG